MADTELEVATQQQQVTVAAAMQPLRVIFLDVDGVISSRRVGYIDRAKVDRIARAVAQVPGSAVVVSSHWRLVPNLLKALCETLRHVSVHVIGATPCTSSWLQQRPLEIVMWLEAYHGNLAQAPPNLGTGPVVGFVAIDDRDLLSEESGSSLRGRFVHTDKRVGVTDDDVPKIVDAMMQDGTSTPDMPAVPRLSDVVAAAAAATSDFAPAVTLPFWVNMEAQDPTSAYTCSLVAAPSLPSSKDDATPPRILIDDSGPPPPRAMWAKAMWAHRSTALRNAVTAVAAWRGAAGNEHLLNMSAGSGAAGGEAGDEAGGEREATLVEHEVIGMGGFGVVRRGTLGERAVAIKLIDLVALTARDQSTEEMLMREVRRYTPRWAQRPRLASTATSTAAAASATAATLWRAPYALLLIALVLFAACRCV